MELFIQRIAYAASWVLLLLVCGTASAQEYVDRYAMAAHTDALYMGTQPLSYPNGVIGTVMRHDRILQTELARLGTPLETHAFMRGADMITPLHENKLDAGLLGNMPVTIAAAGDNGVWIVGLVEVSQNAIVTRGGARVADLAGKRIGYVPVSTAHSVLMQGLSSAQLKVTDVTLVPLSNDDLPSALASKRVDAFAGWEPAISLALAADPRNRIVFRGQSVDYFAIRKEFEKKSPAAARALVAGFARAFEWMRLSQKNVEAAARWVLIEAQAFTGHPIDVPTTQVVAMTRTGILNVPSAPSIIIPKGTSPLKGEYDLLQSLGMLPPDAQWSNVASSFQYDGLRQVLSDPRKYEIRRFDYAP
jgi:sulfonate transport system substrate-binding protein